MCLLTHVLLKKPLHSISSDQNKFSRLWCQKFGHILRELMSTLSKTLILKCRTCIRLILAWTKAVVIAASSTSLLVSGDNCRSVFNTRALVQSSFGSRTAAVIYNFTYRFPFAAANVLRASG